MLLGLVLCYLFQQRILRKLPQSFYPFVSDFAWFQSDSYKIKSSDNLVVLTKPEQGVHSHGASTIQPISWPWSSIHQWKWNKLIVFSVGDLIPL